MDDSLIKLEVFLPDVESSFSQHTINTLYSYSDQYDLDIEFVIYDVTNNPDLLLEKDIIAFPTFILTNGKRVSKVMGLKYVETILRSIQMINVARDMVRGTRKKFRSG